MRLRIDHVRYNTAMSIESLDLRSPVQYLKGVGTQRAEILNRIGIRRASDLLFYFPRDYQDMTERREFSQLEENNQLQTVPCVSKETTTFANFTTLFPLEMA